MSFDSSPAHRSPGGDSRRRTATRQGGNRSRQAVADARLVAYRAVTAFRERHAFASHVLEEQFEAYRVSPADRGLATEIAYGMVRRQGTLDAILRKHAGRAPESVEPGLWTLLQLGAYQLVFLDAVPQHAAVNETVELAHRLQKPRWEGITNGVLRGITRALQGEETLALADVDGTVIPLTLEEEGCSVRVRRFAEPFLAPPDRDLTAYLAEAWGYPAWLVDRWRSRGGDDAAWRLAAWFNTPGSMALRVNPLRTDRPRTLEVLQAAGVAAQPGDLPEAIRLERTVRVENLPGFAEGWFSVQDESAMNVADLLQPQPGERVLDLCAAPGGKTAHVAERMRNEGRIVAADVDAARLALVDNACRRLGISIVETHLLPTGDESTSAGVPAGPFTAALVDVPCSNTGVLGKRPEARWRITPAGIGELAGLQTQLLRKALDAVEPGGRVVYSTCSIEPEENAVVVGAILAERPQWRLAEERVHLPGNPADGGYQALLKRESP